MARFKAAALAVSLAIGVAVPPCWAGEESSFAPYMVAGTAKALDGNHIMVVSHNINTINEQKLQQAFDIAVAVDSTATLICCLQETNIASITAPRGYCIMHSPR